MLTQLTVTNFALVEKLELEFNQGMTAVTGETGAGKSIMLDALGLTLGDRSETGLIGSYADKAEIHATFELSDNPTALDWLNERELATDQAECILRRVIGKDGRSRGFINGAPSTVNDMKALGEMLIDIHSQHEHQSLLKKDTHRRLLDDFAGSNKSAEKVSQIFQEYFTRLNRLDQLINNNEEQSARLQLLTYQAQELAQLNFTLNEDKTLEAEQKRLANAESILTSCDQVLEMCQPNDNGGILEHLSKSVSLLETINLKETSAIAELLSSARIQVEEGLHDLERFTSDFELDPARLQEVEERLTIIYDLCRKHRINPVEILQLQEDIQQELKTLNNIDAEIVEMENAVKHLSADYFKEADKLSSTRQKAANKLKKRVSKQLADLGMSGATFEIDLKNFEAGKPNIKGMEDIEFLISTNPGQTPKALNKIASGGELSRISLAIQVVTADTSQVPTLIFDEVDVGIGGGIAEVVGSLLRKLGQKAQIVCVTHLAQVAAQGHQHYLVKKSNVKKKTITEINALDNTGKIEELARMLGGIEMTDQSLAHAQEMYESAQA